jgi:hypothetical protein
MSIEHEPSPPLNTFIVRFWREPQADQARWYGQVRHIQSGERVAFADESALLSFIRRWIGAQKRDEESQKEVRQ